MKKIIVIVVAILLIGIGAFFLLQSPSDDADMVVEDPGMDDVEQPEDEGDLVPEGDNGDVVDEGGGLEEGQFVLGQSTEGHDILAHHYGDGDTHLLVVGGIHGGYSWNTSLTAYNIMDYLESNSGALPSNVSVTVVPVLNPDGLNEVVGTTDRFNPSNAPSDRSDRVPGRFNGNGVDLNRNFDCNWQSEGTWQDMTVDAGTAPFSEPEARAVRDFVSTNNPDAVIVYYSAFGGVFSSSCRDGVLSETEQLTNAYAQSSGYSAHEAFDFYELTGDMTNWLAKEGVPAISVLLSNHTDVEWDRNKRGLEAVLDHYRQ